MEFADDDEPIPEIPSLEQVADSFPVPLATLMPQPNIRETGVGTSSSHSNGRIVDQVAAISYAIFWNPDDLDDPINHVELHPDVAEAIAHPSPRLPAGAIEVLQWLRFPAATDAVQTHVPREGELTLADRLALHMRNVIGNTFREQRHPALHDPLSFIRPPSGAVAAAASVTVDGVELPAVSIADEHVLGLGVELDDAVATVVLAKHLLPLVELELTRRKR